MGAPHDRISADAETAAGNSGSGMTFHMKCRLALLVLAFAVALTAPRVPAQTRPRLADKY